MALNSVSNLATHYRKRLVVLSRLGIKIVSHCEGAIHFETSHFN